MKEENIWIDSRIREKLNKCWCVGIFQSNGAAAAMVFPPLALLENHDAKHNRAKSVGHRNSQTRKRDPDLMCPWL